MSPALARLLLLTARGRLLRWSRQLRRPKYLIGFLVGVGWISFWILSSGGGSSVRRLFYNDIQNLGADAIQAIQLGLALVVAVFVTIGWMLPRRRLGLPLKESELHLLLPAPLARRQIIQYALLKGQLPVVISAVVFSFVFSGGLLAGQLRLLIAFWLLLTAWELHAKWEALYRLRSNELPRRVARARRCSILAVLLLFWAAVVPQLRFVGERLWTSIREEELDLRALASQFVVMMQDGLADELLTPLIWLVRPAFAGDTSTFLLAAIPPALLLALLHEAVVRSKVRFEETALRHAQDAAVKHSKVKQYAKTSKEARRRVPFALRPAGRAELAIVWKNLFQVGRVPIRAVVVTGAGVLALAALAPAIFPVPGWVFGIEGMLGVGVFCFSPLFPMMFRNDLRSDLPHVEVARTWPVPANRFLLAEVLSTLVPTTLLALGGAALGVVGMLGTGTRRLAHGEFESSVVLLPRGAEIMGMPSELALLFVLTGVIPLFVAMAGLVAALQNVGTLFFPAWVSLGPKSAQGMAAMGQNMVFATGLALVVLAAAIPGVLLVGLALLAQWMIGWPWSPVAFPLWGALAAAPLVVEALILIEIGGKAWAKLDPAQEILETGR